MSAAFGSPRRRRAKDSRIVSVLDVGSYKICCLIGELEQSYATTGEIGQKFRLLGVGHLRSRGISSGAVVDLRLAQAAVSTAISQAEQMASVAADNLHLSVSCGNPHSRTFDGHVEVAEGIVGDADIARLEAGARAFAVQDGSALLSLNRIVFGLDSVPDVSAPLGLAARRLYANHHAVTVDPNALRNLCLLAQSCHIEPVSLLPAGLASALAVTTQAERRAGVTCIDIGSGVASIAGFADGHFVYAASIPIGGQQVTHELAYALSLSLAQAERIKTLYGSLILTASDEHEMVQLTREADGIEGLPEMTRAEVARLVAGSMYRLVLRIRQCLDGCGIARVRSAGVVLTGGVSDVLGLEEFAAGHLARPVRISAAPRLDGAAGRLAGSVSSPAFSCAAGLAMAAATPPQLIPVREPKAQACHGYLGRVEQWLRESF
jgi:cell division protein FtsA